MHASKSIKNLPTRLRNLTVLHRNIIPDDWPDWGDLFVVLDGMLADVLGIVGTIVGGGLGMV